MNTLHKNQQQGVILVLSLVILMAMTLIGVTAMQNITQEERMANNARQRNLAFQAAEAGIRAGEVTLRAAVLPAFDGSVPGFRGSILPSTDIKNYWLDIYNWDDESQEITGFTTHDDSSRLAENPRYVIEEMGFVADSTGSVKFSKLTSKAYRITSRSVGGVKDAVAILQTTYSR